MLNITKLYPLLHFYYFAEFFLTWTYECLICITPESLIKKNQGVNHCLNIPETTVKDIQIS